MFRLYGKGIRVMPGTRKSGRRDIDSYVLVMAMRVLLQILQLDRKPPVTLAVMAVNIATWLGIGPFAMISGGNQPMMCPHEIMNGHRPLVHLFASAFMHAPDRGYHLLYNMASLLWKGVTLELEMGSARFALLIAAMLVIAHGLYFPVSYAASLFFGAPTYYSCAVGFSAVLFGLKVVLNHSHVGNQAMIYWGLPFTVESKYAAWTELILISVVSPHASFVGHLCGILAGMIWLKFESVYDSATSGRKKRGSRSRDFGCGRPV